ncbi:MAG: helix-turn-helix domain-containing protein [Coriobacteriia bacterium]|nr:helix-turn-helix domain-containing protein [Coriobacteriia bacterium]
MQYTYEFEVFESEGWLLAFPFDFDGGTQGEDWEDIAVMAADWLKIVVEDSLMHKYELPKATFGNELKNGGTRMIVSIETSLNSIDSVSATEAARLLGVSPSRVSHMIRDNLLEAYRDGNRTLITKASIEARLADPRKAGRPRKDVVVAKSA